MWAAMIFQHQGETRSLKPVMLCNICIFFASYVYDTLYIYKVLSEVMGIRLNTLDTPWARPCQKVVIYSLQT